MIKAKDTLFFEQVKTEFEHQILHEQSKLVMQDCLKIDLHCHDLNSDEPSVNIGRLIGARETWIRSDHLIETQKRNGATAHTITNHNNARSCFELQDAGLDILSAAEFDCMLNDYNIGLHVLTYGLQPHQVEPLKKLGKKSVYHFLDYTQEHDLPTVLAHPLYIYSRASQPLPIEAWEKMVLLFERFEVLNGQRDYWQNKLVIDWLEAMTPERIHEIADRHQLSPTRYCQQPYKKSFCGGSDDHMGFLSGCTGTLIHVPNLKEALKYSSRADLVLEGLRRGTIAPYGPCGDPRKMGTAFIDYFCQTVINIDDPGLVRLFLHKGSSNEKISAFFITNLIFEIRRHKYAMNFFHAFHNALKGQKLNWLKTFKVSKAYRPLIKEINTIADHINHCDSEQVHEKIDESIHRVFYSLSKIIHTRVEESLSSSKYYDSDEDIDLMSIIDHLEVPLSIRSLTSDQSAKSHRDMTNINLTKLLDRLYFPVLIGAIIIIANFLSSNAMYSNRELLNRFSHRFGKNKPQKRALWLTDTYADKNGVSFSLQLKLKEIQEQNLPIDFLICHPTLKAEPHLKVIRPLWEFNVPFYKAQKLSFPDIIEIQKLFFEQGYDRIICSTEGPMGFVALYLKHAFNVPAYFYIHTDWMAFSQKIFSFKKESQDRLRRYLRFYYHQFDGLFVLNNEDRRWLASKKMNISNKKIYNTHHWVDRTIFKPSNKTKKDVFPTISKDDLVMLYVGRVSAEKGIADLIDIYECVKKTVPNLKLVVAGVGPDLDKLKSRVPSVILLGWVDQECLPDFYSASDLFVLPSFFDTFGRVVLEAMSCGLPVAVYDYKGPREIIGNGNCGITAANKNEMAKQIVQLLKDPIRLSKMKRNAIQRSEQFDKYEIMIQFSKDLGLFADIKGSSHEIIAESVKKAINDTMISV